MLYYWLFLGLSVVLCGRVRPYGSRFISMSNVNPGGWSEYNFTMTFDSLLPSDGYVEITFPKKDYPSLLGLGTHMKIYAPYPNDVSASVQLSDRSVQVYFGLWLPSTPITIMIEGVKNSEKSGGTGNFGIATKVGQYIIDENKNFAVIGLSSSSKQLIEGGIRFGESGSRYAGEVSQYVIWMVASEDLGKEIEFHITFPVLYDLSYLLEGQCHGMMNEMGWQINGSFGCQVGDDFKNVLILGGNGERIQKGQKMMFVVDSIVNPQREMSTPLFKFEIFESNTNNTLQLSDAVGGLSIEAGRMKLVSLTWGYEPYAGYIRTFVLRFRPKNPFISGRISTDLFEILSCQITGGLLDKSENEESVCVPSARMMYISNFQSYVESDFQTEFVEIQFRARIGYEVVLTNPVEIYTYTDMEYLQLVDKDEDTELTRISVLPLPTHLDGTVRISTSSNTINGLVTITLITDLPSSFSYSNRIMVEIPVMYTGIPICEYHGSGTTTYLIYECELDNYGMLTFKIGDQQNLQNTGCPAQCPTLRISNMYNPPYGNDYMIRALIYGDGATTPSYEFNNTFTIGIPTFSNTRVNPVSNNAGEQTAIQIDLNIIDSLPAGIKNLPDPFVSFSFIEVLFRQLNAGQPLFEYDLGTALPDLSDPGCVFETGLTPAITRTLQCALIHGVTPSPTVNDYTIIRIKNYASILTPLQARISIPVQYPSTLGVVPQILIRLIRYDAKIPQVIRQQLFSIASVKNIQGNPLPPSNLVGPLFDIIRLQQQTTITYQIKNIFNVPIGGTNCLFYKLPPGFALNFTQVLVSIDNLYLPSSSLLYFPVFRLLLIRFTHANFANGKLHSLTLEKVDLPISLPSAVITHSIKTTLNGQFADQTTFTIPTLTPGTLFDPILQLTPDLALHPFANYSLEFTTTLNSQQDAIITIDFPPADYSFNTLYDPLLDNIPYCGLYNISDSDTIQYDFSNSRGTISHFAPLIKGQRIFLGLFSISNPSGGTYSLHVAVRDANGNVIEQTSMSFVVSNTAFSISTFDVGRVDAVPNNARTTGIYFFGFNIDFQIPKGSVIIIQFPASYTSLYSESAEKVHCVGSVALRGCSIVQLNREVEIETFGYLQPNSEVEIGYYGLLIQQSAGSVSGVNMVVKYKNEVIGQSGVVADVVITEELANSEASLSIEPRNEGEIAYYRFSLQLNGFDLLTSYRIVIRFPMEYDMIMGIEQLQVTSNLLQGALKYSTYPRHLVITGFYEQLNIVGEMDISVFGIINPNRYNDDSTGTFMFGILSSTNELLVGSQRIEGIIPQLAPQGIPLLNRQSTTHYTRYLSDYQFIIDATQLSVIQSVFGGEVYVDFPFDFIIDSHSTRCETTKAFSFFSSCRLDYFRFFFITNNPLYHDLLQLNIYDVRSPDSEGETRNFVLYNYDRVNQIVLSRTYSNLHLASMVFQQDGLSIDVNLRQPYSLEVGSYSDPILLNVTLPSTQPLTFTPNVLDSRILITPNPVQLGIGQTEVTFRVAAPRDILLKPYYITWSKTGDSLPVTYAPLPKTQLYMVKGTITRLLQVEPMQYMPKNGSSYPLYITTPNPPYQELILQLSFYPDLRRQKMKITSTQLTTLGLANYQDIYTTSITGLDTISLANLSDTNIPIKKLVDRVNYTLNTSIDYPDPTIEIYFGISGIDSDSYVLDTTVLSIAIREQEFRKPKILDYNTIEVTRSTATFQIYGDIKGFIYFVYGDQHMPDPLFNNTQFPSDNLTLSYSNPHYGIDYIRSNLLDITFTITDLQANHDYEIFVFIMNMNRVSNHKFQKIYFQTLKSQKIALFTLKIQQVSIAKEVKLDFITKMAEMISINKYRLLERTTDCKQTQLDQASDPNKQFYWNLIILPDPTNMNDKSSPLVLAENLNSRRAEIKLFISRLDEEPFVTIKEIADDIPNFVVSPEMIERTINSIALRFTVSKCGSAYLIVRERPNTTQSSIVNETNFAIEFPSIQFCSAYQIKHGLNETNQPINFTSFLITDTEKQITVNYTDLNERTVYDAFISLENDFPTQQYLFDNLSVARFTAKTLKRKIPLDIYSINYQQILSVAILLYTIIILT